MTNLEAQILYIVQQLETVLAEQAAMKRQMSDISKLIIGNTNSKSGFSELETMALLGIKDVRTLRSHAKKLKLKGQRYFIKDFGIIKESIESAKKRPHLK